MRIMRELLRALEKLQKTTFPQRYKDLDLKHHVRDLFLERVD